MARPQINRRMCWNQQTGWSPPGALYLLHVKMRFKSAASSWTLRIQSPGSRDKASGAASTHIGIASGSVNKMNGVRTNAAKMQKIAAAAITGIITSNKSNNNTSIDFTLKFSVSLDPLAPLQRSIPSQSYNGKAEILLRLAYDRKPRRKFASDHTNLLWRYYRPSNAKVLNESWRGLS